MIPSQKLLLVALTAALTMPSVSVADYFDGYRLKEFADADDRTDIGNIQPADFQLAGTLIGFVTGVHDTISGIYVCTPSNVKVGQLVGIVKRYVRENPDKWNSPATTLVISSLSSAFPCKK